MGEDMTQARGPEELPFIGKVLFVVIMVVGMAAFSYFVLPYIGEYISGPFARWSADIIFGPRT